VGVLAGVDRTWSSVEFLARVDGRWSPVEVLAGVDKTWSSVEFLARVDGRWSPVEVLAGVDRRESFVEALAGVDRRWSFVEFLAAVDGTWSFLEVLAEGDRRWSIVEFLAEVEVSWLPVDFSCLPKYWFSYFLFRSMERWIKRECKCRMKKLIGFLKANRSPLRSKGRPSYYETSTTFLLA
jgi:hypothetical protein